MPFIPDEDVSQAPVQETPKTGFLEPFKRVGGEIISRAFNLPSQILGGATKATRESLTGTYQAPQTGVKIPLTRIGGKKDIDIGELTLPTLVGAVRGARDKSSVMEELPKAIGVDPSSIAGTALGFAGEVATPDIGDVALATKTGKNLISAFGKQMGKAGEYLAEAGVKPTKTQRTAFKDAAKTTIGKFIADKKLAGNLSENLAEAIDTLQGEFDDIAIRSELRASPKDIRSGIDKAVANLDPIIDKQEIDALVEFKSLLTKKKQGFDISELTRMRKRLDDKIPSKQWEKLMGGEAVNKMVQQRMALQGIIQEIAGDLTSSSGKNLKQLGQELMPLYKLNKLAQTQEGVSVAGRIGGLGDIAAFGTGFASGDTFVERLRNAIAGVVATRTVRNPRFISEAARAAIKGGEELQKPGLIQAFAKTGVRAGKEALISPFRQPPEEESPTSGFIPD